MTNQICKMESCNDTAVMFIEVKWRSNNDIQNTVFCQSHYDEVIGWSETTISFKVLRSNKL